MSFGGFIFFTTQLFVPRLGFPAAVRAVVGILGHGGAQIRDAVAVVAQVDHADFEEGGRVDHLLTRLHGLDDEEVLARVELSVQAEPSLGCGPSHICYCSAHCVCVCVSFQHTSLPQASLGLVAAASQFSAPSSTFHSSVKKSSVTVCLVSGGE